VSKVKPVSGNARDATRPNLEIEAVGANRNDLAFRDRDERLTIEPGDHLEEQAAAERIELARDVVEQEDWRVSQPLADLRQLGELQRQHERPELPLRGVRASQ